MINRPLNDALKSNGLLEHIFIAIGDPLNFTLEKILQRSDQIFYTATAIFDDVNAGRIVQNCKKDMFDTDIFVASFFRLSNSKAESCAKFFADPNLLSFHDAF